MPFAIITVSIIKEIIMDNKQLAILFKKYRNITFLFTNQNIVFCWGAEKNSVPPDKIFIGRRGAPRPDITLSPYDIARVECTKPGLFKAGELSVIGISGQVLFSAPFKDKENMKQAGRFNECLELYKKSNLGK